MNESPLNPIEKFDASEHFPEELVQLGVEGETDLIDGPMYFRAGKNGELYMTSDRETAVGSSKDARVESEKDRVVADLGSFTVGNVSHLTDKSQVGGRHDTETISGGAGGTTNEQTTVGSPRLKLKLVTSNQTFRNEARADGEEDTTVSETSATSSRNRVKDTLRRIVYKKEYLERLKRGEVEQNEPSYYEKYVEPYELPRDVVELPPTVSEARNRVHKFGLWKLKLGKQRTVVDPVMYDTLSGPGGNELKIVYDNRVARAKEQVRSARNQREHSRAQIHLDEVMSDYVNIFNRHWKPSPDKRPASRNEEIYTDSPLIDLSHIRVSRLTAAVERAKTAQDRENKLRKLLEAAADHSTLVGYKIDREQEWLGSLNPAMFARSDTSAAALDPAMRKALEDIQLREQVYAAMLPRDKQANRPMVHKLLSELRYAEVALSPDEIFARYNEALSKDLAEGSGAGLKAA